MSAEIGVNELYWINQASMFVMVQWPGMSDHNRWIDGNRDAERWFQSGSKDTGGLLFFLMSNFDQTRFKEVLGHFATGVTVVTAVEDGLPVGFTCQSFTALSLDPPMIAIAPAKSSTSWPKIAKAGAFCINILADDQEAVCRSFGVSGSDKFANVSWHFGVSGTPVIDSSLAVIECDLGAIYDAGDHELVTGHVLAMDLGCGAPLLFYRSRFSRISRST